MLLCDVRNRWEKLTERPSFFTTGTDEHGLKIQMAAESNGMPAKEFVDKLAVVFKGLAAKSGIDYDRFIRTTDPDHIEAVTHFWNVLKHEGWIYEGDHEGWYAVSDETFYPQTQIKEANGRWYSIESGSEVKLTKEKNYFFRLSEFRQNLIDHLEQNPQWIIPEQKHLELLNELKTQPFSDLSISRPSSRLKWGISVPDDDSQRIYVWIDALVNYLTSVSYPTVNEFWPATHLIGKDIIRFHCVYWPALLLAAKVPLPKQVVVHGHWLCEGSKMSKSKGNVVDPLKMIDTYGKDSLRFFLCENSVLNGDNNFSEESLQRCRDQLVDKYANLVMRCCGKKFDLESSLKQFDVLNTHKFEDAQLQAQLESLKSGINELFAKMNKQMVELNTMGAIQEFWALISNANQFIQDSEPWKRNDLEKSLIILMGAEVSRVCSILISPIIPDLSAKVLDRLNVKQRDLSKAQLGKDLTYGQGANRAGDYPITKLQ
jgi:methionyl-tRNA synthetase